MTFQYKLDDISTTAAEIINAIQQMNSKVVCFNAPMGSGKTTLINAICQSLGVENKPSSPSFSIVNEYITDKGQKLYHADLYRIKDLEELLDIGFEDILYSGNFCFIEWPAVAQPILPKQYIEAVFSIVDKETRTVTLLMQ